MLSTVPGFSRPKSFLLSERFEYVSVMARAMALSVKKAHGEGDDFTSNVAMIKDWVRLFTQAPATVQTAPFGDRKVEGMRTKERRKGLMSC